METHYASSPLEHAIHSPAHQGAIAVVEDPFIQKYLRDVLVRHGYRVMGAYAERVIQLLQSEDDEIDLVITNRPGDFVAFADRVALLYLAAAPDLELASLFPACRVLKKPFQPEHLLAAIRDLIGSV
ncbi:MAG: hypothetical protein LAQ69_44290 [Acidobacteriia bacterium]|nr:hypothetical protein [Terriglobia bacterium]